WQPVILAPLIIVFLMRDRLPKKAPWSAAVQWVGGLALGLTALLLAFRLNGGSLYMVWLSLTGATHSEYVSGFGMNLNWLITYALHIVEPHKYQPLFHGMCEPIYGEIA